MNILKWFRKKEPEISAQQTILLLKFSVEALAKGNSASGSITFQEQSFNVGNTIFNIPAVLIEKGLKDLNTILPKYISQYHYIHLSIEKPEILFPYYSDTATIFEHNKECVAITITPAKTGIFSGIKFVLDYALLPEQGMSINNVIIPVASIVENMDLFLEDICIYKTAFPWVYLLNHLHIGLIYNFAENMCKVMQLSSDRTYANILQIITQNYLIPTDKLTVFHDSYVQEFNSLIEKKLEDNIQKYSFLGERKNILLVAPDFEVGGGQILIARIANFLSVYHNVYLYNARPALRKTSILSMILPSVQILEGTGEAHDLNSYINKLKIDIINSHIWWADKLVYYAVKKNKAVRWVLCMHGCYEALLENPDWDPDFIHIAKAVLLTADYNVYVTQKNHKIFEQLNLAGDHIKQIYTGYDRQAISVKKRAELNIAEESIIFGIVSRAIPEKGWEEAIHATIRLNKIYSCDLLLIGKGSYAASLSKKYRDYSYIHFIDATHYSSEWIAYVQMFDVAMLPTYFVSESLPNAVIEYLAYNKPVISTNIGEIPQMIYSPQGKKAGIVLALQDRKINETQLYDAMKKMAEDTEYRVECSKNANDLFAQFEMKNFINRYGKLFFTT